MADKDSPRCEAIIHDYIGGWPYTRRCDNPSKYDEEATIVDRRGEHEKRVVHVCGVHRRQLGLGRRIDIFTGIQKSEWRTEYDYVSVKQP